MIYAQTPVLPSCYTEWGCRSKRSSVPPLVSGVCSFSVLFCFLVRSSCLLLRIVVATLATGKVAGIAEFFLEVCPRSVVDHLAVAAFAWLLLV